MLQRASRAVTARGLLANLRTAAWHPAKSKVADDDDAFELLPPGCSMIDPTYGVGESKDGVYHYDEEDQSAPSTTPGTPPPATPANLADAQKQLKKKGKAASADNEPYVYLPPGSSMREPGYNSTSDPLDKKVYYRDPDPAIRK